MLEVQSIVQGELNAGCKDPNDLFFRPDGFVEAGNSCNEAAHHFDTSVSFAVKLMALYRKMGSVTPRINGGKRHGKLDPAEEFLLAFVKRSPDVTMPELAAMSSGKGIKVVPQSLSRWLIEKGFSFKKTLPVSEQDRPELAKVRAEWKEGRQL